MHGVLPRFAFSALLLALLPSPAFAGTPSAGKRIAILEVRAVGTFDPKMVEGLSMVVTSEAEKSPFKIVAGSDLSALVGFEKQRALLGCGDSNCLAEIGGGLGVDYLLSTQVSEVGGVWLLSATVLDTARAVAVHRVSRKANGVRDLVDLAQQATAEVLTALHPRDGRKAGSSQAQTAQAAGVTASTEAAPMSSMRKAGIGLSAAGAAVLAGGGVCGILAMGRYQAARNATTREELQDAKSVGKAEAMVADVLYGVGAAVAATGVVLVVLGGKKDATGPAVTLAPSPGGATLLVSGGF